MHGRHDEPDDESDHEPPSVRSFFDTRVRFAADLASCGYTASINEQVRGDCRLALRLHRSADIQEHKLRRRAESLGVRPDIGDGAEPLTQDDVGGLFGGRAPQSLDLLLAPERLQAYFVSRVPRAELCAVLPLFLAEVGGFERWREVACLSDTERVLEYGRRYFGEIVTTPVVRQAAFTDEVCERLLRFVACKFPNIGFGAKFVGYEGLDPDGLSILANASLLCHPGMAAVLREARRTPGAPALAESLHIIVAELRPNTAYMLSLAQDIRAHSVHNLKRFESFLERSRIPDGRIFPQADERGPCGVPAAPINEITWYDGLRESIRQDVGHLLRPGPCPEPTPEPDRGAPKATPKTGGESC
jgi:hypothetical protein